MIYIKSALAYLLFLMVTFPTLSEAQLTDKPDISPYLSFKKNHSKANDTIPRNTYQKNGSPKIIYSNNDSITMIRGDHRLTIINYQLSIPPRNPDP